tara:strand:+ start:3360 stop:3662 length:303 start_codon:yes stop_codon:yes gene_type:complete
VQGKTKEAREMLSDEYGRSVRDLFKSFLILIEDLNEDHGSNFRKLKKNLPDEYHSIIEQADYFDEGKLRYLRKKILDMGNENIRNVENNYSKYIISFDFK